MQQFQWPKGTQAELEVYPEDHPQRKPTERYFANCVRTDINDVRSGRQYANLWLLIDSLKNLEDPKVTSGFHTWFWAIEGVLGGDSCREIGKRVCKEMGFTIEEGQRIFHLEYRQSEARRYGLDETALWEEIHKERDRQLEAEMQMRNS